MDKYILGSKHSVDQMEKLVNSVPQPKLSTPIVSAMCEIEERLNQLNKSLCALENKFQPVVRDSDTAGQIMPNKPDCGAAMTNKLFEFANEIGILNEKINDINNRCEL